MISTKSYHFSDHNQFWSKLFMNGEYMKYAEEECKVVDYKYNPGSFKGFVEKS